MTNLTTPTSANILFYSANQDVHIEMQYLDKTFWLTQKIWRSCWCSNQYHQFPFKTDF
ncbi:hypothetical protein [Pasteurella bettyae]|uniref:hypothetical protein n=1 Tax=Pasteurella bettyae TaxID=752 RepID=UPI0002DCD2A6|nr:hypothetical protein [Pasteurella bettyae]